ncbi:multiprotein-bridging factor 1 family protein [Kitasatospora sp. NPDC008050]|uniref:helix-turn-helix domain-containing protein n=1 Tax=Kitasatospora sp. NPDC008050 TaxID=3364021 RepID=UPI0036E33519
MNGIDIGSVIRGARSAARMTQNQLGEKVGYSGSAISRIESGRLRPDWDTVARIAMVLNIAPGQLGLQEGTVRRRELLAGAAGVGITLAGLPAVAAAAPGPTTGAPASGLEVALFSLPAVEAVPLPKLVRGLAAARAEFTGARYGALGARLPALLAAAEAARDAASGQARERAQAAVARGYVLATELALKEHSEIAWATADRALAAARTSGDPIVLGEATRVLAITMRRAGRTGAAVDLLRRTATGLDDDARQRAVGATLLMTAAYTAATSSQRADALDLMGGAEESVRALSAGPGGPLYTVDASSAQADLYWVGIHNALGTPDEGVGYAQRLTAVRWPTVERTARAGTDVARMWQQLGDPRRTFAALRQVEQAAPEEVRRPALRAMTSSLLYGPTALPGLREFAQRTGAI